MNNISERLEYIRRELGYNYKDFGTLVDITGDAIRVAINRNKVKPIYINVFCDKLNINKVWLETGVGDVYKNPTSLSLVENHLKNEAKSITYENYNKVFAVIQDAELNGGKKVPYYDVDFTSSFLEVENNQQNTPNYYISHPFFIGCDMVVRNSGQSMAKVIAHGDAIGLVRLNNWRDFFPFGEIYGIVTTDNLRMIKVITKGESENSYTLISKPTDSKKDEFPNQQIKIKSILHIFKVQASSHLF